MASFAGSLGCRRHINDYARARLERLRHFRNPSEAHRLSLIQLPSRTPQPECETDWSCLEYARDLRPVCLRLRAG